MKGPISLGQRNMLTTVIDCCKIIQIKTQVQQLNLKTQVQQLNLKTQVQWVLNLSFFTIELEIFTIELDFFSVKKAVELHRRKCTNFETEKENLWQHRVWNRKEIPRQRMAPMKKNRKINFSPISRSVWHWSHSGFT